MATTQAQQGTQSGTVNGQAGGEAITHERLAQLLNEDLAREYQAVIAYVVYSQVLKGPEYMSIAKELEQHAKEELDHAMIISKQLGYLGVMPVTQPMPVRTSESSRDLLQFDLEAEIETIKAYRQRVKQCEALGEFALAEQIREILVDEQDHYLELATALGRDTNPARDFQD